MNLNRRDFIKLTGAGLATSCIGALGFGVAGEALAALVRPFKLAATTENSQHLHLLLGRLRYPHL